MSEFTPEEMEGIVKAISQKKLPEEKIPLRPPGSYGKIGRLSLSPLPGELPRPLTELTSKEKTELADLKAHIEVVFGETTLTLKELASLEKGTLLPLDNLCDDLVDIYVNSQKIGRGEIVTVDGHFGVKIISFTKN